MEANIQPKNYIFFNFKTNVMKSDYEKPEITTIIMDNEISLTTISAPDDP